MKKALKGMLLVLALMPCGMAVAGNPANWDVNLETSGADISWVSTTRVNPTFTAYDCNVQFSQVEVLCGGVWTDYSAQISTSANCGTFEGVAATLYEVAQDVNGVTANIKVWTDADGYAHASITNVVFGTFQSQSVTAFRMIGTVKMLGMQQLFMDSFDSYGTSVRLNTTGNWSGDWMGSNGADFVAGSDHGNRAYYTNGYFMDQPRIATLEAAQGLYDPDNCRFRMDVYDAMFADSTISCSWFLIGRYSEMGLIRLGAVLGEHNGVESVYARIADTTGYSDGDYYVAYFDKTKPITLELDFKGNEVLGRVNHAGSSAALRFTTTITGGKPGMAGWNAWGYAYGYYDNFSIYSNVAVNPSYCGDVGTIYTKGDVNKDCKTDFKDFAQMASDWLKCTDPNNAACN